MYCVHIFLTLIKIQSHKIFFNPQTAKYLSFGLIEMKQHMDINSLYKVVTFQHEITPKVSSWLHFFLGTS